MLHPQSSKRKKADLPIPFHWVEVSFLRRTTAVFNTRQSQALGQFKTFAFNVLAIAKLFKRKLLIEWRTPIVTGITKVEMRKTRRARANITCKIFCDKMQTQAQVLDISTGGSRVQIRSSVLSDLIDENWQIELPEIGAIPFKLIWSVAPDHGLAFQIDDRQTDDLLTWITRFADPGE